MSVQFPNTSFARYGVFGGYPLAIYYLDVENGTYTPKTRLFRLFLLSSGGHKWSIGVKSPGNYLN